MNSYGLPDRLLLGEPAIFGILNWYSATRNPLKGRLVTVYLLPETVHYIRRIHVETKILLCDKPFVNWKSTKNAVI
ncbi:hypothetical protein A4R26_17215 [Niastella populi]|uniref:Uncharacterized protein n=1 Tax=Niastella populi TaxID=550983 RepID=A0A1V9FX26_9BACT|nr:hypothetical protein A4R26_17215 [Niastella populi]